ncbi:MAG: hypothetical protein AB1640_11440 [bacterium]
MRDFRDEEVVRSAGSGRSRGTRFTLALAFPLCLVTALSCLYPFPPPEPGPTRDREGTGVPMSAVFSHKEHETTLVENKLRCTDCHLYDLAYLQRDRQINEEITRALTQAGQESCHFCHVKEPEGIRVSLKCLDCHADIRPIRPRDHTAGWKSAHGARIELSETACSQCHSNRYCLRCHTRRDEAERSYHRGSALLSHPIEARADPGQCRACHQASYCTRCHRSGRF